MDPSTHLQIKLDLAALEKSEPADRAISDDLVALGSLAPEAIPAIIEVQRRGRNSFAQAALAAMGAEAVPPLAAAIRKARGKERESLLYALHAVLFPLNPNWPAEPTYPYTTKTSAAEPGPPHRLEESEAVRVAFAVLADVLREGGTKGNSVVAGITLRSLGDLASPERSVLTDRLRDKNTNLSEGDLDRLAEAISYSSGDLAEALLDMHASQDDRLRRRAEYGLFSWDLSHYPEYRIFIVSAASNQVTLVEPRNRVRAVALLGDWPPQFAWQAIPCLIRLLADPVDSIAIAAADSLGRIGLPAQTGLTAHEAASALAERLGAKSSDVSFSCALALSKLGSDGAKAVPVLVKACDEEPIIAKRAHLALDTLVQMGAHAQSAIPALRKLLNNAGYYREHPGLWVHMHNTLAAIERSSLHN